MLSCMSPEKPQVETVASAPHKARKLEEEEFKAKLEMTKTFCDTAKSYVQISSVGVALPLLFRQAMLGDTDAKKGLLGSLPWTLGASWLFFLLSIGLGLVYQWLSIRRLWDQYHAGNWTPDKDLEPGYRTTKGILRIDKLNLAWVWLGMTGSLFAGAAFFVVYSAHFIARGGEGELLGRAKSLLNGGYALGTMPNDLFVIPSFLRGTSLFLVFVVALLIFHWLLVFPWPLSKMGWKPLGKRGWKIVDYIWLSAGSIALVATAFQARQILATNMIRSIESLFGESVDPAKYYSSPGFSEGLLCRKFNRGPLSPPPVEFDRTQKEYDEACAWAKEISARVAGVDRWTAIDTANLPAAPKTTEDGILFAEREIHAGFDSHNAIVSRRQALESNLARSEFELTMAILAPLLAVIALALRMAKVTGELRLEKDS